MKTTRSRTSIAGSTVGSSNRPRRGRTKTRLSSACGPITGQFPNPNLASNCQPVGHGRQERAGGPSRSVDAFDRPAVLWCHGPQNASNGLLRLPDPSLTANVAAAESRRFARCGLAVQHAGSASTTGAAIRARTFAQRIADVAIKDAAVILHFALTAVHARTSSLSASSAPAIAHTRPSAASRGTAAGRHLEELKAVLGDGRVGTTRGRRTRTRGVGVEPGVVGPGSYRLRVTSAFAARGNSECP